MKGVATIQVIKDGQVIEQIREENTITNAAKNLLSLNDFGFPFSIHNDNATRVKAVNVYTPLNVNMFGGVLLFNNKKEGSDLQNKIIPDKSDFDGFIGNAGGGFSGQSKFRGTLNESESTEIENGYKWVWDFGTGQTNLDGKTINRICLTSRDGGDAGFFKDSLDTTKTTIFSNYSRTSLNRAAYMGMYGHQNGSNFLIPHAKLSTDGYYFCSISKNEFITVKRADDVSYSYTFKRFRIKTNLSLNDNVDEISDYTYSSLESLDLIELLEQKSFTSTVQKGFSTERYLKLSREGSSTYATSITYNKTDKLIYYRKFKLDGTFELIEDTSYTIPSDIVSIISNSKNLVEYENYIYFIDTTNHILYKVSKEGTYSSYIIDKTLGILNTFRGMLVAYSYSGYQASSSIVDKKKIGFWNGSEFVLNDFYYNKNYTLAYYSLFNIQDDIYNEPIFISDGSYGTAYDWPIFNVFTPFFSSINNLSSGITKQTGTTLKIIYEITNS